MDDIISYFKDKKNLINFLLLAVLVAGMPLGIRLAREQQIFKSSASTASAEFLTKEQGATTDCVVTRNNTAVAVCKDVDLKLTAPTWTASQIQTTFVPNLEVNTVYAGHEEGTEGWWCNDEDGQSEVWHDQPDGEHSLWEDCDAGGSQCRPIPAPAGFTQDADCGATACWLDGGHIDPGSANNGCSETHGPGSSCSKDDDGPFGDGCTAGSGGPTPPDNPPPPGGGSFNMSVSPASGAPGSTYTVDLGGTCGGRCETNVNLSGASCTSSLTSGCPNWNWKYTCSAPSSGTVNLSASSDCNQQKSATFTVTVAQPTNCTGGKVCDNNTCSAPSAQCGTTTGTKSCRFTTPSGCTPVDAGVESCTRDNGNNCGGGVCSNNSCVTTPTASPTPSPTASPTPSPTASPTPSPGNPRGDISASPASVEVAPGRNGTTTISASWTEFAVNSIICMQDGNGAKSVFDHGSGPSGTSSKVFDRVSPGHTFKFTLFSNPDFDQNNPSISCAGRELDHVDVATTAPAVTTAAFRVSETNNFDDIPWVSWTGNVNNQLIFNGFSFSNENVVPAKFVFVQFKSSDDRIIETQKSIRFVGPDPDLADIAGCSLNESTGFVSLAAHGSHFGPSQGSSKISVNGSAVNPSSPLDWSDDLVRVKVPSSLVQDQRLSVTLTRGDGAPAVTGACKINISQVSLGSRLLCRSENQGTLNNVNVAIVENVTGAAPSKEIVTLDKDGVIQGLKTKLQAGKQYKIGIKAPKSLRKVVTVDAVDGTTFVRGLSLPVGDISPAGGNGQINSADVVDLIHQWRLVAGATTRTADFNGDNLVNSVDFVCQKQGAGAPEDPEPVGVTPETPPASSLSPSPQVSPSVSPSASP